MKYICSADWHLRSTTPRYRKDDFVESQFNKIKWILLQSKLHRASLIIAGDIFDTPKISYEITNKYLELFKKHPLPIICCVGNHDQRYATSNLDNIPLQTLSISKVLSLKSNEQVQVCSWNDSIPKEGKEILLIHKTITEKTPPPFLDDAVSADTMLRNNPQYKYIVSGDFHQPHLTQKDNRWLINSGSIMRQNKDQQNHKPRVFLLDTEKNLVKTLYIPVKPASKVFDLAKIEREDVADAKVMSEFIQSIKVSDSKPNFKKILTSVISKASPKEEVKNIIATIMEEI